MTEFDFEELRKSYSQKMMSIGEIHTELLDILQVIHDFCTSHGIRYMLHGGTLIGAIRHNGFIPWDDDADVSMPRPDYDRFIKEFPDSDEFKVYAPEKENCGLIYGRLCEMTKTRFVSRNPWCEDSPGIGVDILPMDGIRVDREEDFVPIVAKAWGYVWNAGRYRSASLSNIFDLMTCARFILRDFLAKRNFRRQHKFATRFPFDTSPLCAQLANPRGDERELIHREWIDEHILAPFEDRFFMIPKEYDKVLTRWFGDYMTPPPVDKQVVHTLYQFYCWR